MTSETITWIWLAAGGALALLELLVPGLVIVFLGIAAVLVAGLRFAGVIEDLVASIALWMALSVLLVLTLRRIAVRWFPGDTRRDPGDEELDSYGQVVEVVEDCGPDEPTGRVRYQGTSWPALTLEGTIPKGHRARLLYRHNIAWMVELVPPDEDPRAIEEALDRELTRRR